MCACTSGLSYVTGVRRAKGTVPLLDALFQTKRFGEGPNPKVESAIEAGEQE